MKKLFYMVLLLSIGCGSDRKAPSEDVADSCTQGQTATGLMCNNGTWQVLSAGRCLSNADCAGEYRCVSTWCAVPTWNDTKIQRTLFLTQAVRPGAVFSQGASDYAYNVMAKGYQSLDDLCLAEAQQSALPSMRNLTWKAIVIAQPDNSYTGLSSLSLEGQKRLVAMNKIWATPAAQYSGPGNSVFSQQNNAIYDKNGVLAIPQTQQLPFGNNPGSAQKYYLAWFGLALSWGACPFNFDVPSPSCSYCVPYVQDINSYQMYACNGQTNSRNSWSDPPDNSGNDVGAAFVSIPCSIPFGLVIYAPAEFVGIVQDGPIYQRSLCNGGTLWADGVGNGILCLSN